MRQEAPQVKNSRLIHLERKLQEFKKTNPNCDAVLKCKIIAAGINTHFKCHKYRLHIQESCSYDEVTH